MSLSSGRGRQELTGNEHMSVIPSRVERQVFDEQTYLTLYPDIELALQEGREGSAWGHYDAHGRREGRRICLIDEGFYLAAYPLAAREIRAGAAADAYDHYLRLGFARGYTSHRGGPRPANPANFPSPFGGLWPDLPNAADIIEGKLEIGQINAKEAERLRFWIRNGYVILERAVPDDLIGAARIDLDRAYSGHFPDLRFDCPAVARGVIPYQPEVKNSPAKACDIHHFSPAIRNLMFCPAIEDFLALIFESKAFASQTLGFFRGSAQEGHQDSAFVPYTLPRQFAASWIALEDVTLGAGELFYHPGSHNFPDYLYAGKCKSVSEASRMSDEAAKPEIEAEVDRHVRSLEERSRQLGLDKKPFAAKRGDVLIWHADLVHGGNPVSTAISRKSIVTHYCPKRVSPLFSEQTNIRLWEHNGHFYTTSYYAGSEPVGSTASPALAPA